MNGLYISRDKTVTDSMKGEYKAVVLDSVDETKEPKRNPNLDNQYAVVKNWDIPILFRVVIQAQWYCDLIADIHEESSWDYAMSIYTLKDMSALLHNPYRANAWIIACAKDNIKGTTNTWIAESMKHVQAKASEKWGRPFWYEFSTYELGKDTSKQLVTLKDNQDGEWIARIASDTSMFTGTIILSDNLYNILDFIPAETGGSTPDPTNTDPIITDPVDDSPTGGNCGTLELAKLSEIALTLDAIKIILRDGLDGIFKLLEAYAPWRKR